MHNICDVCVKECFRSYKGLNYALLMACFQGIPPIYVDERCAGRPVTKCIVSDGLKIQSSHACDKRVVRNNEER